MNFNPQTRPPIDALLVTCITTQLRQVQEYVRHHFYILLLHCQQQNLLDRQVRSENDLGGMGGTAGGGRNPGEKVVGGLREAGKERVGNGIPKVAGSGRNRKKVSQHCVIAPVIEMDTESGVTKEGAGTGVKCPPPPPVRSAIQDYRS